MIRTSEDGAVCVLTLDRPARRNALSVAGLDALRGAVGETDAPVVYVRGAGSAFCAGADLSEVEALDGDDAAAFATRGQADVALANRQFLAADGRLLLAVKARSEDVTARPADVFERVLGDLSAGYEVLETHRLEPHHDDHLAVVATPQ